MGDFENYVNNAVEDDKEATFSDIDKIQAFMVQQGVRSALTENPFATAQGQLVTSISEDSEERDIREGTLRIINFTQTNPTGGVFGNPYYPTAGYIGKIKEIVVSTNATTAKKIRLRIIQGITGEQANKDFLYYVVDSAPLIFKHPIIIGATGTIQLVSDDAFTGNLFFTAVIVEKPLVV